MGFKLDEKDFIICWWVAESLDGDNFLMLLRRTDEYWSVDYRFRYKRDDKAFDSTDERSFFRAKVPLAATEAEMLEVCQQAYQMVCGRFCCKCTHQRVDGNVKKFMETLERYPDLFHIEIVQE